MEPKQVAQPPGLPSIFSFQDYRKFLTAYVSYRKRSSKYSFKDLSNDLEFGSANYAGLIARGKRNLSSHDAYRLGSLIGLSDKELRYLCLLIHYNHCESRAERVFYKKWIEEFSSKHPSVNSLAPADTPNFIMKWHLPGILSCLHGTSGCSVSTAAALTKLPRASVASALETLVAIGFARVEGAEYYLQTEKIVNAQFGKHFLFADFQMVHIYRSLQALRNYQQNGAKFIANTFLLSDLGYQELLSQMREFISAVEADQVPDESSRLVQLNVQLFNFGDGHRAADLKNL